MKCGQYIVCAFLFSNGAYRFNTITTISECGNGEEGVNIRKESKRVLEIHGYEAIYTAQFIELD
jgi:hypothetical protein